MHRQICQKVTDYLNVLGATTTPTFVALRKTMPIVSVESPEAVQAWVFPGNRELQRDARVDARTKYEVYIRLIKKLPKGLSENDRQTAEDALVDLVEVIENGLIDNPTMNGTQLDTELPIVVPAVLPEPLELEHVFMSQILLSYTGIN